MNQGHGDDHHRQPPPPGPACVTPATHTSISTKDDDDHNFVGSNGRDHFEGNDDADIGNKWGRNVALGMAAAGGLSLAAAAPFVITQLRSPLPYMATPRRKVVAALDAIASGRLNTTGPSQKGSVSGAVGSCGGGHAHRRRRRRRYLHLTDLGSGDGEAVLAAVSTKCTGGRGWTATGIELNPTLWAVSSIRRLTSLDADGRRRTRFVLGDMFNLLSANSSSAWLLPTTALAEGCGSGAGNKGRGTLLGSSDAVMIFGVKSLMGRVASLLRDGGAEPGTYVLSYRFRLPLIGDGTVPSHSPGADGTGAKDAGDEEGGIDATLVYDVEDMRIYRLNGDGHGADDHNDGEGSGGPDGRGA